MKISLLVFSLLSILNIRAQNQQFKLDIEDNSIYKYAAYIEIKEQLGNEGWGAWEKMSYSFVIKDVKNESEAISFQICYNKDFISLFGESERKDTNHVYCFPLTYYPSTRMVEVKALPNFKLQNFDLYSNNARHTVASFTFKEMAKRDVLGLFAAHFSYDSKKKKELTRLTVEGLFESENSVSVEEKSAYIGDFEEDKNLKELHLTKEFEVGNVFFNKYPDFRDIQIYQSSHVAFNKAEKFTEIFQGLKGYTLFFEEDFYDISFHYMLTRIEP